MKPQTHTHTHSRPVLPVATKNDCDAGMPLGNLWATAMAVALAVGVGHRRQPVDPGVDDPLSGRGDGEWETTLR